VYPVQEDGSLQDKADFQLNINIVIATMEAVLIEALEPRQNRRHGDEFQAVEFFQFKILGWKSNVRLLLSKNL
jgi:hypothetical protein